MRLAETFLILPLNPNPQVPEQVSLSRRWAEHMAWPREGQAGSGFSPPAAVHAGLGEGPVGICPLGVDCRLDRHGGDCFLGAYRKLWRAAQAEA